MWFRKQGKAIHNQNKDVSSCLTIDFNAVDRYWEWTFQAKYFWLWEIFLGNILLFSSMCSCKGLSVIRWFGGIHIIVFNPSIFFRSPDLPGHAMQLMLGDIRWLRSHASFSYWIYCWRKLVLTFEQTYNIFNADKTTLTNSLVWNHFKNNNKLSSLQVSKICTQICSLKITV